MSGARAGVVVGLLAAGCAAGSTARPQAPPALPARSVRAAQPYVLPAAEVERMFGGAAGVAALRSCVAVEVRRDVGGFGLYDGEAGNVFGYLPEPTGVRVERGPLLDTVISRLLDGASYARSSRPHHQHEYVEIALRFEGRSGERVDLLHATDIWLGPDDRPPCYVLSHGGTIQVDHGLHDALRALEDEAARRAGWTTRRP